MKVYTYFEHLGDDADTALLSMWMRAWDWAGLQPVILTDREAAPHPACEIFQTSHYFTQSANAPAYERACFKRWCALAQVGGGLMADWDVIPYSKEPWSSGRISRFRPVGRNTPINLSDDTAPCLLYAEAVACESVIELFRSCCTAGYVPMHQTVSDQHILADFSSHWDHGSADRICLQYGRIGWEKADAVHYPNAVTTNINPGVKRSHLIATERPIHAIP